MRLDRIGDRGQNLAGRAREVFVHGWGQRRWLGVDLDDPGTGRAGDAGQEAGMAARHGDIRRVKQQKQRRRWVAFIILGRRSPACRVNPNRARCIHAASACIREAEHPQGA